MMLLLLINFIKVSLTPLNVQIFLAAAQHKNCKDMEVRRRSFPTYEEVDTRGSDNETDDEAVKVGECR